MDKYKYLDDTDTECNYGPLHMISLSSRDRGVEKIKALHFATIIGLIWVPPHISKDLKNINFLLNI